MKLYLNNETGDKIKIYLSSRPNCFLLHPSQNLCIPLDSNACEITLVPYKSSDYSALKLMKFAVATKYTLSLPYDHIQLNVVKQQKENDSYVQYYRYVISKCTLAHYNCSYVYDKEVLLNKEKKRDALYISFNLIVSLFSSSVLTAIISMFLSSGLERVIKFLIFLLLFVLVFVIDMVLEFFFTRKSSVKRLTDSKYMESIFSQKS